MHTAFKNQELNQYGITQEGKYNNLAHPVLYRFLN
jgi:hypothetical protein